MFNKLAHMGHHRHSTLAAAYLFQLKGPTRGTLFLTRHILTRRMLHQTRLGVRVYLTPLMRRDRVPGSVPMVGMLHPTPWEVRVYVRTTAV